MTGRSAATEYPTTTGRALDAATEGGRDVTIGRGDRAAAIGRDREAATDRDRVATTERGRDRDPAIGRDAGVGCSDATDRPHTGSTHTIHR